MSRASCRTMRFGSSVLRVAAILSRCRKILQRDNLPLSPCILPCRVSERSRAKHCKSWKIHRNLTSAAESPDAAAGGAPGATGRGGTQGARARTARRGERHAGRRAHGRVIPENARRSQRPNCVSTSTGSTARSTARSARRARSCRRCGPRCSITLACPSRSSITSRRPAAARGGNTAYPCRRNSKASIRNCRSRHSASCRNCSRTMPSPSVAKSRCSNCETRTGSRSACWRLQLPPLLARKAQTSPSLRLWIASLQGQWLVQRSATALVQVMVLPRKI